MFASSALQDSPGPFDFGPALCEKIVVLMDKLRRSVIEPFMTTSLSAALAQDLRTQFGTEDLKNQSGGPFVLTRVRTNAITSAWSTAATVSSRNNVGYRLVDNDSGEAFSKQPVPVAALQTYAENTWLLDRPHVVAPQASFTAIAEEFNIAATTQCHVTLLGEVVYGGLMSADDVRQAVALGIYPALRGHQGSWTQLSGLIELLKDDGPRCASLAVEKLRWELRARIAELRQKISRCRCAPYILESRSTAVSATRNTELPGFRLRNDSGHPIALSLYRVFGATTRAANQSGAAASSRAIELTHLVSGGEKRMLTWRPTSVPTLISWLFSTGVFERALVLGPNDSMGVQIYGKATGADTDIVHMAIQGEILEGIGADELREAVSLGLYSTWHRDAQYY